DEAFRRGLLHSPELFELTRIEEHGVWVEFLQEARYGTLVEGLLGGEGIGCVRLEDGVSVNYGPDLRIEVVRRPQVDGSAQQDGGERKHPSIGTPGRNR